VPGGVISGVDALLEVGTLTIAVAEAVRRCLVRYEADRGSDGLVGVDVLELNEDRRLTSGELGAEEAGEQWEGGV
jgi:hypothetical protein